MRPPPIVRNVLHRLERVINPVEVAPVGDEPRDSFRLAGAEIGGFQKCAERTLRRYGIPFDELAMSHGQATKILRPGPIHRAVDDDVADLSRAKLLGNRRKGQIPIDLAIGEKLDRFGRRMDEPADVPARVHAYVSQHEARHHFPKDL